jgi:hypothetical protein
VVIRTHRNAGNGKLNARVMVNGNAMVTVSRNPLGMAIDFEFL